VPLRPRLSLSLHRWLDFVRRRLRLGLGGAALGAYAGGGFLLAAAAAAGLTVVLVGFVAEQLRRWRVAEA
jgi:hypothetical protein